MSILFEKGFEALETATFTPKMIAATLRKFAIEADTMKAEKMEMTFHYCDGAQEGQMVPEITIRAIKYNPEENDDDDDEDFDEVDGL